MTGEKVSRILAYSSASSTFHDVLYVVDIVDVYTCNFTPERIKAAKIKHGYWQKSRKTVENSKHNFYVYFEQLIMCGCRNGR